MSRKAIIPTDDKKETQAAVSMDEIEASNALKKSREGKRDEVMAQDLMYGKAAYKRTVSDTMQERDMQYARLHSFAGPTNVQMFWDFHPDAIAKQLFKLRVGSQEVVLSAVELQKYLRWC